MEQEALVSIKLRKSLESSKEFVSKGYHNVVDFVTKTYAEHKESGNNKLLTMAFAKYVLVFLDILYLVTSLVMINIGTVGQLVKVNFNTFRYELDILSIYWIATGVILLLASIFGLIGAFKESVIWTNVFGVMLVIVFLIQISSAIIAFQFIGKSQSIAHYTINRLMNSYSYDPTDQERMNWIQRNFQCCGNDGPSDWNKYDRFVRAPNNFNYESTTTTLATPLPDRMPASCCVDGSNYNNLTCDKYYPTGCCIHVRGMLSETVMIIGSLALAIAVLEILGIFFAFVVAKIMRKTKSLNAIRHYDALNNVLDNGQPTSMRPMENASDASVETI